jgi:hypothetical protein
MNETKFTKEPWQSTENTIYALRDGSNAFWAAVYVRGDVSDEEHQAVIALMKAAPQMYEHLDRLIGCLEEVEHGHDASLAIEASKSVLKAARGEQ